MVWQGEVDVQKHADEYLSKELSGRRAGQTWQIPERDSRFSTGLEDSQEKISVRYGNSDVVLDFRPFAAVTDLRAQSEHRLQGRLAQEASLQQSKLSPTESPISVSPLQAFWTTLMLGSVGATALGIYKGDKKLMGLGGIGTLLTGGTADVFFTPSSNPAEHAPLPAETPSFDLTADNAVARIKEYGAMAPNGSITDVTCDVPQGSVETISFTGTRTQQNLDAIMCSVDLSATGVGKITDAPALVLGTGRVFLPGNFSISTDGASALSQLYELTKDGALVQGTGNAFEVQINKDQQITGFHWVKLDNEQYDIQNSTVATTIPQHLIFSIPALMNTTEVLEVAFTAPKTPEPPASGVTPTETQVADQQEGETHVENGYTYTYTKLGETREGEPVFDDVREFADVFFYDQAYGNNFIKVRGTIGSDVAGELNLVSITSPDDQEDAKVGMVAKLVGPELKHRYFGKDPSLVSNQEDNDWLAEMRKGLDSKAFLPITIAALDAEGNITSEVLNVSLSNATGVDVLVTTKQTIFDLAPDPSFVSTGQVEGITYYAHVYGVDENGNELVRLAFEVPLSEVPDSALLKALFIFPSGLVEKQDQRDIGQSNFSKLLAGEALTVRADGTTDFTVKRQVIKEDEP